MNGELNPWDHRPNLQFIFGKSYDETKQFLNGILLEYLNNELVFVSTDGYRLSLKKKEIGVLITDHNVRETLSITDRSYLLFNGNILKSGTSKFLAKYLEKKLELRSAGNF